MMLKDKIAVIYGAGGAVGGAVARAFAREGARVFLTGRTLKKVEVVAKTISAAGGKAESAEVDALEEKAIEKHLDVVIKAAGRIDISFNASGISGAAVAQQGIQGVPLVQLSVENFSLPIATYTKSHFLTARAAVRRMLPNQSGVILMHTPEPARLGVPMIGGMGPGWAAMEALSRNISAEYGAQGVRSVCLRTTGMPETETIQIIFGHLAKSMGVPPEQLKAMMEGASHTHRSTKLEELANAAAFAVSNYANGITGTVVDLTGGKVP